jgi:hypothetical protein
VQWLAMCCWWDQWFTCACSLHVCLMHQVCASPACSCRTYHLLCPPALQVFLPPPAAANGALPALLAPLASGGAAGPGLGSGQRWHGTQDSPGRAAAGQKVHTTHYTHTCQSMQWCHVVTWPENMAPVELSDCYATAPLSAWPRHLSACATLPAGCSPSVHWTATG